MQPAAQGEGIEAQVEEDSSICHDSITQLRFTVPLEAPLSASVVSPLTTLVSHAMTSLNISSDKAQAIVKHALGLEDGVDLLTYNTMKSLYKNEAGASSVLVKTSQVMNIVNQGQALFEDESSSKTAVAEATFEAMAKTMSLYYDEESQEKRRRLLQTAGSFDLTSATFVSQLYKDTATSVGLTSSGTDSDAIIDSVAKSLADLNTVLSDVSGSSGVDVLQEVAKVDIVLQTEVKDQVSKLVTGTIDTQLFDASTSTQVVKNKAESTEIPVDVEAYLKSADSSGVEVSPVGGESPPAKSGGGGGDDSTIIIVIVVVVVGVLGLVGGALLFVQRKKKAEAREVDIDTTSGKGQSGDGPKPCHCCWGDADASSSGDNGGILSDISYTEGMIVNPVQQAGQMPSSSSEAGASSSPRGEPGGKSDRSPKSPPIHRPLPSPTETEVTVITEGKGKSVLETVE